MLSRFLHQKHNLEVIGCFLSLSDINVRSNIVAQHYLLVCLSGNPASILFVNETAVK